MKPSTKQQEQETERKSNLLVVGEEVNGINVMLIQELDNTCDYPTCSRIIERGRHCFLHAKDFEPPKEKKKQGGIAKVSDKRKEINKEYKKIKEDIISKDDRCKIKSPDCTGKAQGLNHSQKRSPSNLTALNNLVACCNPCNLYLETHSKWAMANGHTISRFKK